MIAVQDFLQRILHYYAGSFDVTRPYALGGHSYAALAALHAHEDQYVRFVGTQLWAADSHEYTLFETYADQSCTAADVERAARAIREEMEPLFVRSGQPLPPADHQYTWLTVVLLCEKAPDPAAIRAVQKFRFTRFYRFYLRGYSEGRLLLADLENGKIYTNAAGRGLKKLYRLALQNAAKAAAKAGPAPASH